MSHHETSSASIIDFKTALFGRGEAPWQPYMRVEDDEEVHYMRIELEGEGAQLAEFYRGMSELKDYPGCNNVVAGMGGDKVNILVPLDAFEEHVRPFIAELHGAAPIHGGRTVLNDPESILRHRVHGLLFESGSSAWRKIDDNHGGGYRRALSDRDMMIGDKRYDFQSDILPLAKQLLQEKIGIDSLSGFESRIGRCAWNVSAEDFLRLHEKLGEYDAGTLAHVGGVSHLDRVRESRQRQVADRILNQGK